MNSKGKEEAPENPQSAHLGEVDLLTIEHAFPRSLHTPGLGLGREETEAWSHHTGHEDTKFPNPSLGAAHRGLKMATACHHPPLPGKGLLRT